MPSVDPATFAQLRDMEQQFDQQVGKKLTRHVAKRLFQDAHAFKRRWRPDLDNSFKSGGQRILRGFRIYTEGNDLESLQLGIFTRWKAAELYQRGGTITPRRTQWLVIPLSPRVLTPTGRVRRQYRNAKTGGFSAKFWQGIFFINARRGLLAVREVTGTPHSKVGFRSRQFASSGARITNRSRPALEIVAVLVKKTRRDPILDFFNAYERYGLQIEEISRNIENLITPDPRAER